MKKSLMILAISSLLWLSACDDQNARDYAGELVGVLKSYQTEVNKKITAEQKSYKELATTHAATKQADIIDGLRTERFRLGESLADKLREENKIRPSDIYKLVADYANADFAATRQLFEQESDGQTEYLASLESLEMQSKNLGDLIKALQELAKPKSDIKQLKELGAAAKEFKKKFDELQCEDLAEQIACLNARKKEITDSKTLTPEQKTDASARVQTEIDSLGELSTMQKCDESKLKDTKCPDKKGQ